MTRKHAKPDKFFLIVVGLLVASGLVFFVSASLGVLSRDKGEFYSILLSQLIFGLLGGSILFYLGYKIEYGLLRKWAPMLLIGSIILTILVFVPGLGFSHGGARRWITLGFISFQPVEFLKIAYVIYLASWFSWIKHRVADFRYGILPLAVLLAIIAVILFQQPDTKSFLLMFIAGASMLFVSGVPIKYLALVATVAIGGVLILAFTTPYLHSRIKTFLDPSSDPLGSSYQLQQSLIGLGSGGVFGRGLGQSVQKFGYLPEPQGDSVFAVIGEEMGFVGATGMIILYVLFALRGLRIAYRSPDSFSRLLVTGIVILISMQSLMNIGAVTGVFPLTGVPLVFVSHGGTSLAISLGMIGLVANISRFGKDRKNIRNE